MDQSSKVKQFVPEWLNHFNVPYNSNVELNSTLTLDFHLPDFGLGVYIVNWKRPISVQVANKAIQIQRELELNTLYLISKEISEPAQKSLKRFGPNIVTIHPNGLSELAIHLAQVIQSPTKKQISA